MQSAAWETLFNTLLLVFWFAAWNAADRATLFNPYLGPLHRWIDALTGRLGRLGLHPGRGTAAGVFALLLLGRSALVAAGGHWPVQMGFLGGALRGGSVFTALMYSPLSFCLFLFQVWSLSVIYVHTRRGVSFNNTSDALSSVSRPFTDVRPDLRPLVLMGFGMAIALVLQYTAGDLPQAGSPNAVVALTLARAFVVTLAAWTSVLLLLRSILIVLIIASWVSMFTGTHALMAVSRDWLDFLLGPLRNLPLRIGMFDLTPIVMIFALDWAHRLIMAVLMGSYLKLA